MEIKPIHTDADYKATLREVSGLIDLDPEPAASTS
jgi:HTH-type transcriptional regulator / antitoxin HigA